MLLADADSEARGVLEDRVVWGVLAVFLDGGVGFFLGGIGAIRHIVPEITCK
jgi:hypothetical protein